MTSRVRIVLFAAFGLSGTAALIYEVVWTRALALILGSTTYPGTTHELFVSALEETGLRVGEDFSLCFAPEDSMLFSE